MEQNLTDRGDGEALVNTKVGGMYSTDSRLQPCQLCLYCVLIMLYNTKSGKDRCTLVEHSLSDRGDGEEQIDTKAGGVHSTESRLQPSQL